MGSNYYKIQQKMGPRQNPIDLVDNEGNELWGCEMTWMEGKKEKIVWPIVFRSFQGHKPPSNSIDTIVLGSCLHD